MSWKVELQSEDLEELAYQWLSEVNLLIRDRVGGLLHIQSGTGKGWRRHVASGSRDMRREDGPGEHSFLCEVKAVTRHKFGIKKNELWCIQAVLDV